QAEDGIRDLTVTGVQTCALPISLLGTIGGLVSPDAGRVLLDGTPVTGPGPDRAMVFQAYSLLPRLSLVDNVRVAAGQARPDRSKIGRASCRERVEISVGAVS